MKILPGRTTAGAFCALLLGASLSLSGCSKREPNSQSPKVGTQSEGAAQKGTGGSSTAVRPRKPGVVVLSENAIATAKIEVERVRREPASAPGRGLEVPGQITVDPARVAVISARVSARVEKLTAAEGDRVHAGQTVAYLSSPAFVTSQSDYLQARRREVALTGTADETGASALVSAARQRLVLQGVPDEVIRKLEAHGEPSPLLPLTAPFGGSIVEARGTVGTAVGPGEPIYRIADLSVVNATASIPERSLAVVRPGQTAFVLVPAFPDNRFEGRVARLGDELDSATRTVKAVVRVSNPARLLRPGMFATVRIELPGGAAIGLSEADSLLTVPENAVVSEGEEKYVFVRMDPRTFERRPVEIVPLAPPGGVSPVGGRVFVRSGLTGTEEVVVQGAFTLKSELAKSRLGESD